MNYFGATINDTATVAEKTGVKLVDPKFLAVKYDASGNVVLCGAGETALGIVLPETPAEVVAGDDITVQIRHIGYAMAGAEIAKGAEVMSDANGRLVTATAGKFIIGIAMSAAAKDGAIFSVDIRKCGYKS